MPPATFRERSVRRAQQQDAEVEFSILKFLILNFHPPSPTLGEGGREFRIQNSELRILHF